MKLIIIPLIFFGTILAAQNKVGINTNNPTGNLEVHDADHGKLIISSDNYTADSSSLILRNMNGTSTGTEFIFQSNREEGLLLRSNSDLAGNTSPQLMMFKPDGKVGIGVSNPSNYLTLQHTVSSGTYGIDLINNGAGNAGLFMRATNWHGLVLENAAQKLRLGKGSSASNIQAIVMDAQDRVAIGHDNPQTDLHVVGSPTQGTTMIGPDADVNGDSEIFLAEDRTGANGVKLHYNGTSNRLEFKGFSGNSDQGPHMVINRDNGNVGIGGVINPQVDLHIAGDIRLTGLVGIGNRNIITDANGQLIVGPPTSNVRVYSVNPAAFHCGFHGPNSAYRSSGFSASGTYSGDNCASHYITAPLYLEHGDVISKISYHFEDYSASKNLQVSLLRKPFTTIGAITITSHEVNVEGAAGTVTIHNATKNFVPHTVDNTQNTYFLLINVANLSSISVPWPNSGFTVQGVVIE